MRNPTRTLLLGLGLTLAWALPASAANWAAPTALSPAGATIRSSRPPSRSTTLGFGVVTWSDTRGDVSRRAARPWRRVGDVDPPLSNGVPVTRATPFASIDTPGNAMVVWSQCGLRLDAREPASPLLDENRRVRCLVGVRSGRPGAIPKRSPN